MDDKLLNARQLCLIQALSFIEGAERLDQVQSRHIVYHLCLLALEEIGKASMLGARMIGHSNLDGSWIERSLDSHRRKLQWAVWSPLSRIDPADFYAAREFAERAHSLRLDSLYVDPKADLTDVPPREKVRSEDSEQVLALARSRLEHERGRGIPSGEVDALTEWFLDTMADPNQSRLLLSRPFIVQYETMGGDARKWAAWAREEFARLDEENRRILETELARPAVPKGSIKPRWRANTTVYTPSHSLRPKVLRRWNERIETAQLVWSGKKNELTLQITLHDNEPLPSLGGRIASLAKLVVACLNIGSIGYFWFEKAGFEQKMFKDVRDLELGRTMELVRAESFWGDGRAVALTEELIDHSIYCMMAFAPLPDAEADPIFGPYLHGLALIAKSDLFYDFNNLARASFVTSLAAALHRYGNWSGQPEEFDATLHAEFTPLMPEREHRDQVFRALKREADPAETPLANLRTAKHLADLYLIHVGRRTWRTILDGEEQALREVS